MLAVVAADGTALEVQHVPPTTTAVCFLLNGVRCRSQKHASLDDASWTHGAKGPFTEPMRVPLEDFHGAVVGGSTVMLQVFALDVHGDVVGQCAVPNVPLPQRRDCNGVAPTLGRRLVASSIQTNADRHVWQFRVADLVEDEHEDGDGTVGRLPLVMMRVVFDLNNTTGIPEEPTAFVSFTLNNIAPSNEPLVVGVMGPAVDRPLS